MNIIDTITDGHANSIVMIHTLNYDMKNLMAMFAFYNNPDWKNADYFLTQELRPSLTEEEIESLYGKHIAMVGFNISGELGKLLIDISSQFIYISFKADTVNSEMLDVEKERNKISDKVMRLFIRDNKEVKICLLDIYTSVEDVAYLAFKMFNGVIPELVTKYYDYYEQLEVLRNIKDLKKAYIDGYSLLFDNREIIGCAKIAKIYNDVKKYGIIPSIVNKDKPVSFITDNNEQILCVNSKALIPVSHFNSLFYQIETLNTCYAGGKLTNDKLALYHIEGSQVICNIYSPINQQINCEIKRYSLKEFMDIYAVINE